jgi:transcriptional regulator with XRE-family HTH domain
MLDPVRSFHEQLKEEVAVYERLKRGEFEALRNFEDLERWLVALRIAKGLTQRELAERLGVHESQVSRDECNEYHGITLERARRILHAMNVDVQTAVLSSTAARARPALRGYRLDDQPAPRRANAGYPAFLAHLPRLASRSASTARFRCKLAS